MAKSSHRNPTRGFQYLVGNYVYYQRLRTDGYYPQLAERVNARQLQLIQDSSNLEYISSFFAQAAQVESAKELALLKEKFDTTVSGSYGDVNFAKDLIYALNECLGIKAVFERNLALIKESQGGQKNVMSFFPTYFNKVWEENSDRIFEAATKSYTTKGNITLGDALADEVNKELPSLIKAAILKMFGAKVETGINKENRSQYEDAYKEIAEAVEQNRSGTNEFITSFIRNYQLDKLVQQIRESINNIGKFKSLDTNSFNIKAQMAQRGGMTMEDFRTLAFNFAGEQLAAGLRGNDTMKVKVEGVSTGSTKMKPDSVATVDIPLDIVEQWLRDNSFGTRAKDTAAIIKLQEKLKGFDDGFITYVNAKNYTLNRYFEEGRVRSDGTVQIPGFSAGEKISLASFQEAANNLEVNYSDLVYTCLQLIPGAIGEDQIEETKLALTRAIASALFDDFNAVGVETAGARSIHLLDLNGVLMPISFYFWLLSEAFGESAAIDPQQLISVEIETPENILFPDSDPEERKGGSYTRWTSQSIDAMRRIKIGYHFLSGYKSIMQSLI